MSSYLRTIDIDRYLNSTLSELYISDFFPTQTNLILHNIDTSDYELCWTLKKMKRPRKDRKKIYRWRPCTGLDLRMKMTTPVSGDANLLIKNVQMSIGSDVGQRLLSANQWFSEAKSYYERTLASPTNVINCLWLKMVWRKDCSFTSAGRGSSYASGRFFGRF